MSEEERIEEINKAAEAVEEVAKEREAAEAAKPKPHSYAGKGLMERRESFAQSSVPNAHKGYSGKTPRYMLGILAILFIISFILAGITG